MNRSTLRPVLAALSLALAAGGLAAGAHAGTAPASEVQAAQADKAGGRDGRDGHHHRAHKRGFQRAAAWVPGLGPLPRPVVDSLKLNESQQAQLDKAREAGKELRAGLRDGGQRKQALDAQLAAGQLDPRALVAAGNEGREQFRAKAEGVEKEWLAFWDGLSAEQRGQVVAFAKERQARMAERQAKWEQRKGKTATN